MEQISDIRFKIMLVAYLMVLSSELCLSEPLVESWSRDEGKLTQFLVKKSDVSRFINYLYNVTSGVNLVATALKDLNLEHISDAVLKKKRKFGRGYLDTASTPAFDENITCDLPEPTTMEDISLLKSYAKNDTAIKYQPLRMSFFNEEYYYYPSMKKFPGGIEGVNLSEKVLPIIDFQDPDANSLTYSVPDTSIKYFCYVEDTLKSREDDIDSIMGNIIETLEAMSVNFKKILSALADYSFDIDSADGHLSQKVSFDTSISRELGTLMELMMAIDWEVFTDISLIEDIENKVKILSDKVLGYVSGANRKYLDFVKCEVIGHYRDNFVCFGENGQVPISGKEIMIPSKLMWSDELGVTILLYFDHYYESQNGRQCTAKTSDTSFEYFLHVDCCKSVKNGGDPFMCPHILIQNSPKMYVDGVRTEILDRKNPLYVTCQTDSYDYEGRGNILTSCNVEIDGAKKYGSGSFVEEIPSTAGVMMEWKDILLIVMGSLIGLVVIIGFLIGCSMCICMLVRKKVDSGQNVEVNVSAPSYVAPMKQGPVESFYT